jgi:hypothetical protein
MPRAGALLSLIRWPGALTAAADVATCFLLAHGPAAPGGRLAAAGAIGGGLLLYAGGIVLNDVADAEKDRAAHPSRPIPSGAVSRRDAAVFGAALLVAGIAAAALLANPGAGALAAAAAAAALLYDFASGPRRGAGALFLGLARGANAAVGATAALGSLHAFLDPGRFPSLAQLHPGALAVYAALLTWFSRFEDERPSPVAAGAAALALSVAAGAAWIVFPRTRWVESPGVPLLLLVGTLVVAAREAASEEGPGMGLVVRAGVFGFLLVDAAWLMGAARWDAGFGALLAYLALRLALLRARS